MDLPSDIQPLQPKPQSTQHLLPLGLAGVIVCLLLLAGIPYIILFEQQQRTQEGKIALASPSPLPPQSTIPSPLPTATYEPQVAGMSKKRAFELFRAVTFDRDVYGTDKHLVRWERASISWRLHSQFTSEDRACLTSIAQQFNSAMKTAQLEETLVDSSYKTGIHIYVLPREQFSSVNTDIRPEKPDQLFYTRSGYGLSSVDILIDLNQPASSRCFYLHNRMLQAVGLASSLTDANYTNTDLEMLRILYSPLLTTGLTAPEVERRLMQ